MNLSKHKAIYDPWDLVDATTLVSPPINGPHWEQIILFPEEKDDDYAIEVELTALEGETLNQIYREAGVIFRYSGENQYYYAGLGGFGARTFVSMVRKQETNSVWIWLDSQGRKDEIKLHRPYKLRIECQGAKISLSEDDRNRLVIEDNVYPSGYWGLRTVRTRARFSRIKKSGPSTLKVFVIMPFTTSLNFVYETIHETVTRREMHCRRADASALSRPIIDDIKESLLSADLIIADLTDMNPNVYYEAGYADALKKNLILVAQKGTQLGFDMRHIRTLFYGDPEDLRRQLRKAIEEHMASQLGGRTSP